MRKITATLAALSLMAGPAAGIASAQKDPGNPGHHHARNVARQQCQAERKALGVKAFRAKYGMPNAFAKCVKAHRPTDKSAAVTCRAERKAVGGKAFRQKYGKGNALNKCIKANTAA
jgi:hypothetical protein